MTIHSNPELELAFEYVRATSTSIFLTGKAGSGKTTFLHKVKAESGKRFVVLAPTGVAAINAGGMTIHSFFQLPFGLHLPNTQRKDEHRNISRKKLNLIRSLQLLVIDEISMVRADLLDAIDESLRRFRGDSRPFGGVQLLMIGDLHQLPPVVNQEDWDTLRGHYSTPYFFGSLALQKTSYVSIELKHIYRQTDASFIDLLNKVRDNRLDEPSLRLLNSRYIANFRPPAKEPYITLTATNAAALDINTASLKRIPGKPKIFSARIEGDFPPSSFPTEEKLEFKVGAQVMFIKNDLQPEKRFFNGKIGRVVRFDDDAIVVQCPGDPTDIAVTPAEWKNVKYSLNESTKEIEEQVLGLFVQYPLKLAWAITIHKSQGLTFDRAIIDAHAAFAHGQVYVALSRCRSFEGIVLRSRIEYSSVKTDPVVKQYSVEAERNAPTKSQILAAKREYQQCLVQELFSFQTIQQCVHKLCQTYQENQSTLTIEAANQVTAFARQTHESLVAIAEKFQPQLVAYLQSDEPPESNSSLQQRISKAATYFNDKIALLLQESTAIPTASDNQAVHALAISQLGLVRFKLFVKQANFKACGQGFSTATYQRSTLDGELDFQQQPANHPGDELKVPRGVPHPELYRQLLEYRLSRADSSGVSPREILTNESLRQLVSHLPTTENNLRRIHGIGSKRLKRYGSDIAAIVQRYCESQKISPDQASPPKPAKSSGPNSTKQLSLQMFQAGKTVEQIASERGLTVTTIQGHLAYFVSANQLDIHRLLEKGKLEDLERYWQATPTAQLNDAKAHFGNKYTYGELRLALSHIQKDPA